MELDNPFAFFIEEHLTEMCTSNAVAEKPLAENKSLKEICNRIVSRMRKEAQEANQGKKSAVWGARDEVLLKEVDEYYELDTNKAASHARRKAERVDVLDLC